MKTLTPLSVIAFSLAQFALAQQETPEAFCIRTAGANYVPILDAQGQFNGNCEISAVNVCLGTEYADAKTGATLCCLPPNTVQSNAGKQGCCPAAQNYKWDANAQTSTCITPPPPPPPVSCPGSAGQYITRNGIRWQVFCGRNVRETVPLWQAAANMNRLGSPTGPMGGDNWESCLNQCASNPACHGVNSWTAKNSCGLNTKPLGTLFRVGSLYELPPPVSSYPVMSFVSVPKR